ncbi:uncharacterized protein RSE6_12610 [Rhynchosporium secalis]|uniref:Uncharacterized protein n=1 Tax=Rhynchosporium secalis TaxID=38038 RepID=A0A1E1MQW6_RHYSE|nr:uncharacterized protein RSE6_12610 [Rhynchosporium secalis]
MAEVAVRETASLGLSSSTLNKLKYVVFIGAKDATNSASPPNQGWQGILHSKLHVLLYLFKYPLRSVGISLVEDGEMLSEDSHHLYLAISSGMIKTVPAKVGVPSSTWRGGNGKFLDELVDEINKFTENHAGLEVLDCTKYCGFNTDTTIATTHGSATRNRIEHCSISPN